MVVVVAQLLSLVWAAMCEASQIFDAKMSSFIAGAQLLLNQPMSSLQPNARDCKARFHFPPLFLRRQRFSAAGYRNRGRPEAFGRDRQPRRVHRDLDEPAAVQLRDSVLQSNSHHPDEWAPLSSPFHPEPEDHRQGNGSILKHNLVL